MLIIGSGAGGAVTAAALAARRPFASWSSRKGRGSTPTRWSRSRSRRWWRSTATAVRRAALGRPAIALRRRALRRRQHRDQQRPVPPPPRRARRRVAARRTRIDEFGPGALDRYARAHRRRARPSRAARRAAAVVGRARTRRHEARLAVGRVLARVPLRDERPRGQADDGAHVPSRGDRGRRARSSPTAASPSSCVATAASIGARCERRRDRTEPREPLTMRAEHVFVCAGATQTPALLQRSGIRRNIGNGLEDAPDRQDRGALPAPDRPRRRADAPRHRVRARPHDRRLRQPARSRRARARRLVGRLRRRARRTGSTSPSTTPRFAARAPAACSRCPVSARRSSRTT